MGTTIQVAIISETLSYIYIYNLGGESIVITSLTVENCEESEP